MVYMQRFKWWVLECISSAIVLASFLSYRYYLDEDAEWTRFDSLFFFAPAISVFLSILGMVASVLEGGDPAACRFESVLVWAMTILWAVATIAIIIGPFRTLELSEQDDLIVLNPNVYFFSLFSMGCAMIIMASWFNQFIHGDDEKSVATQWILLGSISFLSMISAIASRDSIVFQVVPESLPNGTMVNTTITVPACDTEAYSCKRVTFAIVLSAISATVACLMTPWKGLDYKCQADVSLILFIAWLFGIGYLTFGTGPGARWNSLYFSCYINAFLCLDILVKSTAGAEVKKEAVNSMRRTSTVDRGAVFEAAYNQLGRFYHEEQEPEDRTGSYADLFETVELDVDDDDMEELPTLDRQSYVDQKQLSYNVQRLELWCIILIESFVNIASLIPAISKKGSRSAAEKLILMLPSLSIVVGFVGFATCMRRRRRARIIQAISIAFVLMIWVTAIPFMSYIVDAAILGYNDGNDTEIDRDPNLFFSTWIALTVCILLVTNVFRASIVTSDWVLLATFSFALMASSIVYFNNDHYQITEDGEQELIPPCTRSTSVRESTCQRATLAFYLGLLSGILSLIMIPLYRCGPILHLLVSFPLLIFWGVAVAYITFNARSGVAAGILYFSCWISAFVAIDLTTLNLLRVLKNRKQRQEMIDDAESRPLDLTTVPGEESAAVATAATSAPINTDVSYGEKTIVPLNDTEQQEGSAGTEQARGKRVSIVHEMHPYPSNDDDDEIIYG